ncbi:predicted protein [Plenodomus lingam JN3]|uniref:Predicted protein n=1 Tax=Leptosphaeria maculans (strain JN3 / isolate v23.1.3 / race Av1-4-5-6-7-8) TaxID=985895 RepID=E5A181_LEPMJ|nr:predicted protein [Plenodomus lingam JN3]CBX97345.1 predicted protein [Plenodomus lingam JN3]
MQKTIRRPSVHSTVRFGAIESLFCYRSECAAQGHVCSTYYIGTWHTQRPCTGCCNGPLRSASSASLQPRTVRLSGDRKRGVGMGMAMPSNRREITGTLAAGIHGWCEYAVRWGPSRYEYQASTTYLRYLSDCLLIRSPILLALPTVLQQRDGRSKITACIGTWQLVYARVQQNHVGTAEHQDGVSVMARRTSEHHLLYSRMTVI